MKKLMLFTALTLSALSVSAQVEVDSLNRLMVGDKSIKFPPFSQSGFGIVDAGGSGQIPTASNSFDKNATICVIGSSPYYTNGYITFGGHGDDVLVGEAAYTKSKSSGILRLRGAQGIRLEGKDGIIAEYDHSAKTFTFNCDVNTDGVFVNSDSRLKTNIEQLTDITESLASIDAISYNLVRGASQAQKSSAETAGESEQTIATMKADERERFGFVAQQVKEVFPQLVSENEEGYLAVDYIGFIPLLVDAVNTLSEEVKQQREIIASLTSRQQKKSADGSLGILEPSLSQNRPNPFTASSTIECTLPETVADANLYVYDLQGKQLMKLPIIDRGHTSITVDGRKLGAGMYIYSLVADGQEIDSKRMIVND